MSKIPQGEWSAIAARYAKGESISRIAQSYGCTPPAIHYILKRSKQRAAKNSEHRVNEEPNSAISLSGEPRISLTSEIPYAEPRGVGRLTPGEVGPAGGQVIDLQADQKAQLQPAATVVSRPPLAQRPLGIVGNPGRGSAFTAGLDGDLHGRAEAAIAAFRSSFDAALEEGSPGVRQRLRQAASDLMRVAARTTIVLDRLTAKAEREAAAVSEHLRSSQGR
jgi:hypothetical protein